MIEDTVEAFRSLRNVKVALYCHVPNVGLEGADEAAVVLKSVVEDRQVRVQRPRRGNRSDTGLWRWWVAERAPQRRAERFAKAVKITRYLTIVGWGSKKCMTARRGPPQESSNRIKIQTLQQYL